MRMKNIYGEIYSSFHEHTYMYLHQLFAMCPSPYDYVKTLKSLDVSTPT